MLEIEARHSLTREIDAETSAPRSLPAEHEHRQVAPIGDLTSSLLLTYHLGIGQSYAGKNFFTSKPATVNETILGSYKTFAGFWIAA
jgi:hypothetical protein